MAKMSHEELEVLCSQQAEALNRILNEYMPLDSSNHAPRTEQWLRGIAKEALSSPGTQKLLRRMEVYSKALAIIKDISKRHIQGHLEDCPAIVEVASDETYDLRIIDKDCDCGLTEILTLAKEEGLM